MAFVLMIAMATAGEANGENARGPAQRGFVDRIIRDASGEHRYVVFVPEGRPPQDGWPVILFLHGAGERGTDGRRQLSVGLGPLVKLRAASFPAVVVFPQAENFDRPILQTWSPRAADGRRALAILAEVEGAYPINAARRVLTGWSMGAFGAWGLAAADPARWSAVVTVSGGGRPETVPQLARVPVWAFHGTDDRIVPVSATRNMVQSLRNAGQSVLYSEVKQEGHDVWRRVYDSEVVLNWMLAPDAGRRALESVELPEDRTHAAESPFVPAMIVERAMTVRLGQEAVDIMATGLPASLKPEALSGNLDDVTEDLELDGRTFDVHFEGLSYTAQLERAVIRAYGADRVQAEIGLRNVRLHVGRIAVSDGSVGFTAGPAEVVVGHRQPVWLRIEARPAIDQQRLALKPLRSSFEIPDFNWFVREPQGIRLQGDWLTEEEVKTAVIGGIYVRRETIEEQVLSAVPALLDRFGEAVDLSPLEQMVSALWPLPVYRPDVRVLPESISTDTAGVSLTFSVAVAAVDATPPHPPQRFRASAPPAYAIGRTTDLRVGIAVDVLDHISSLLAGSDAARIFTSDIPDQPFTELADPTALSKVLSQTGRLSSAQAVETALVLEAPLRLRPLDKAGRADRPGVGILIEAPRLAMHVSAIGAGPSQESSPSGPAAASEGAKASVSLAIVNASAIGPAARTDQGVSDVRPKPIEADSAAPALSPPSVDVVQRLFDGDIALSQPVALEPVLLESGRMGLRIIWESDAEISIADRAGQSGDGTEQEAAAQGMAELFSRGWKR
ncbi:MAG: hypothetical protein AB7I48_25135, partial [Planctomycetaceae bacterium]